MNLKAWMTVGLLTLASGTVWADAASKQFGKLRDKAKPAESLAQFLTDFIGDCGSDPLNGKQCQAKVEANRKASLGQVFILNLDDSQISKVKLKTFNPRTHEFEFQAAAFGVLRVALDLVHHLGLRERERGLVRRQGSGVAERVPNVDDVALVEAGEPKLLQRDRVELGCGDEEPILEQGEFYAVVGRFARGGWHEVSDRGVLGVSRGDVVCAGRADAVGGIGEDGEPRHDVKDGAGSPGLAAELGFAPKFPADVVQNL